MERGPRLWWPIGELESGGMQATVSSELVKVITRVEWIWYAGVRVILSDLPLPPYYLIRLFFICSPGLGTPS
jgi:hypothetical protein